MSEPLENPILFPSMSYAGVSPAKIYRRRVAEPDLPGQGADSGLSTPESLARYDLSTSSWKTSEHCWGEGFREFSETLPKSGMTRNGGLYPLPISEHPTAGNESGLWPTPVASDGTSGAVVGKNDTFYETASGMPRKINKNGKDGSVGLGRLVKLWPTPQASDNRDRGNLSSGAVGRRREKGKQISLSQSVSETSGALNPPWVEWLMGYPIGWTDLGLSETQ